MYNQQLFVCLAGHFKVGGTLLFANLSLGTPRFFNTHHISYSTRQPPTHDWVFQHQDTYQILREQPIKRLIFRHWGAFVLSHGYALQELYLDQFVLLFSNCNNYKKCKIVFATCYIFFSLTPTAFCVNLYLSKNKCKGLIGSSKKMHTILIDYTEYIYLENILDLRRNDNFSVRRRAGRTVSIGCGTSTSNPRGS